MVYTSGVHVQGLTWRSCGVAQYSPLGSMGTLDNVTPVRLRNQKLKVGSNRECE